MTERVKGSRNIVFDAVKALAIWLVVFAHSIQYVGVNDYWTDPVFQFIYSFHMPLFFVISGFFFSSAERLGWKDFLFKKSVTLLLPCFIWAIVYGGIQFSGLGNLLHKLLNPMHWPFWFLKGLFLVQLIIYVCSRISAHITSDEKKQLLCAIVLSLIIYVMPFMSVPRIMISMFWAGYLIRRYYDQFMAHYILIGILSLAIYSVLFMFWDAKGMKYYAGALPKVYEIIGQMKGYTWHDGLMILYRIAIGLSGSVTIIALMHAIKKIPNIVAIVGSTTQGIYILQALILETILGSYLSFVGMNYYIVMIILLPLLCCLVIGACIFVVRAIEKNDICASLFIGKFTPKQKDSNYIDKNHNS